MLWHGLQALDVIIVEANISDTLRTVLKEQQITVITAWKQEAPPP